MSDRKKGGGLDYTPRAFPGARAPDGPAPDLEDQLAKLGLVDRADAQEPRSDARSDVNPGVSHGGKKRGGLEYTPQAFPGARAPDGPAPDLEDRLVAMGLAERTEARDARPDARHDANYAPTPPQVRQDRPAVPPPILAQAPAARRERIEAPVPPARSSTAVSSASSSAPSLAAPPEPAPTRRAERAPTPEPDAPQRTERAAPSQAPVATSPAFTATPQPVYVVPAPGTVAPSGSSQPPQILTAASPLPPVPPEAAPRPLPLADLARPAPGRDITSAARPSAKLTTRTARNVERLKKLSDKEERIRLSIRLVASVDQKLNDLAHLRGLDRNTAVSVAIVQDWVECFALQAKQATR